MRAPWLGGGAQRDDVVERHGDVLQNIEFAIVSSYRKDRSLLDLDVLDGLEAVIRRYVAETQGRAQPRTALSAKASDVYAGVGKMCEWRLGRISLGGEDGTPEVKAPEALDLESLLACLKRVRKSVRFWNESAGRQGYLEYVKEFVV
jgi:hypothetical protein